VLRFVVALLLVALSLATGGCKDVPKPPEIDLRALELPTSVDGALELFKVAGSRLDLDPTQNDAISALGRCSDLVTYCYTPGQHSVEECLSRSRTCATRTPWNESEACCPQDCKDAYRAERDRGSAPLEAFEKVLFLEPDCFPGVRAALEGMP
jgi:hypothetical protein